MTPDTETIIAAVLILLFNVTEYIVLIAYFAGAHAVDGVYIYINLAQMAAGALVLVVLCACFALSGGAASEAPNWWSATLPAYHVLYHTAAFAVLFVIFNPPHTPGDTAASLTFMFGASLSTIGQCISFLRSPGAPPTAFQKRTRVS